VTGLRRRVGRLHEQPSADLPPLDARRPEVLIERACGTVLLERACGTVLLERACGTVLLERASGTTIQAAEQALVFLLRENLQRAGVIVRRANDLSEDLRDLGSKLGGDRPVRRDHPAERGDRVARVRFAVCAGDVAGQRDPAGIAVFHDRNAWLGEL